MDPVVVDGGQNDVLLNAKIQLQSQGGYELIEKITPYIEEMGRFAVMEHNKQTKEHLQFIRVLIAAVEEVAFKKRYQLVIEATNGIKILPPNPPMIIPSDYYMAVVLDDPITHSWTLESFIPLIK